ncbi:MAG: phosphate ABC transporter permease subunit PstC [Actinomycetota bacterium]|nr:phosphate ABC transporter permease subunit PstC [Actinomycetota bacterium]
MASAPLAAARPRWGERAIKGVLFLCALVSIATTVGIVLSLVEPTVAFFQRVGLGEFLTGTEWSPLFEPPRFGVLPLVTATLVTTVCALFVCIPCGLGSAIYLSEYARDPVRRVLKPILEILAGIPTVVYGFFALALVTPLLRDLWFLGRPPEVFNAASAGLVMGIMILPTVASLSEDAMAAVPRGLREGAFALGGTKLQVSTRVVLPAALSGIVASFVLAVSRAVGETMIVLIAAGGTPNLTLNPAEAMQTMTAFIAAAGIGDQPTGSTGYLTIFAVGSALFVITLAMNAVSIRLVRRFREVYE